MTKKPLLLCLISIFSLFKSADAQVIELRSGNLNLNSFTAIEFQEESPQGTFNNTFYGLAQKKPSSQIKKEHIIYWLANDISLVKVPLTEINSEGTYYNLPAQFKMDPLLLDSIPLTNNAITITANTYEFNTEIEGRLKQFGDITAYNHLNKSLEITLPKDSISSLASQAFVFWLELPAPELEMHNLRERTNHRVPLIQNQTGPFQLTGKGVVMGEWDGGGADDHIDYEFRHTRIDPFVLNNNGRHATHVAGTMLGAGIKDPAAKGMAPDATFYSYDFFGSVINEMDSAARKYGIEFTQNSYGYNSSFDNCTRRGTYDNNSVGLDRLTNKYPNLLHVFSAGNSRSSNCLGSGYGTVGSGYQSSKNSLAVGAVRFTDVNSWFSSYGPVRDGRLKPEITAVGVDVYSTFPNDTYRGGYNGTSMSCPGTSGTAALITQLFKEKFDTVPDAHLIKGVLCNAADDLGRAGPDYQYGFGRLNGFVAANIVNDTFFHVDTISQNGIYTDTIFIDNPHLFKVMLCYTDIESFSGTTKALINDLDLYLVDDAGDTLFPWVLNPTIPAAAAARGVDTLNNIEQVTIAAPASDYYVYHVVGTNVPSGNQIFSVNWLEQDTSLTIVYPNGGEKWVPPTNTATRQIIRWDAKGISGTGTLSYSLDSGSNWTTITAAANLNLGYFIWQNCPANANSSTALIKIEQGSFVDSSDAVFDIFQTGPVASAVPCSEQLHITWNSIPNAEGYMVYMNDSGAMKNMGYTQNEFFTIKGLADTTSYWIAISAVAANGAEGPRGIAQEFTPNPAIQTPDFTSTPMDSSICSGSGVSFSSSATGTGTITRMWQVSSDLGETWQDIASSNTDDLVISEAYRTDDSNLYRMTAINSCQSLELSDWGMLLVDSLLPFGYVDTFVNTCIGQDPIFELVQLENTRNKADWYYLANGASNPTLLATDTSLIWEINDIQIADRGEYYAELKNSCGTQQNAITIELDVNDSLKLNFTGNDTICLGQIANNMAVASGGRAANYDYFWQLDTLIVNSANLLRAQDSTETWQAGVFDFCSADTVYNSKTIVVRSVPEITLPADTTICLGTAINIEAMATGGNSSSYHYIWSNNLPDSNIVEVSPSITTTYTVILTDSCTTRTDTAEITVNVLDALNVQITSAKDTLCVGENNILSISGMGGDTANYSFVWDNGSSDINRTINSNTDTTYFITLTDNCSVDAGKDSIKITVLNPLGVVISGKDTLCTDEVLNLSASPSGGDANNYSFLWDDGSTTSSRIINSDTDTSYFVQVTDNCTILPADDTFQIMIRPPLEISISGTDTLCTDEIQTLTATVLGGDVLNHQILWDDGSTSTSRTIFTDKDSTFYVQLTDNCTVAPANDSFKIAVRPPLNISISGPDTICLGEQVTLSAVASGGLSSAYSFDWSNASTASVQITGNQDTTISLELSDGCTPQSATTEKTITVRAALELEPISTLRTCKGNEETIELKAKGGNPNTYQFFVNGAVQTSANFTRTYTDSTKLLFRLADNCSAKDALDSMWIDIRPIDPVIFDIQQENLIVKAKTRNDGNENWWGNSTNNLNPFPDSTVELSYSSFGSNLLCLQKIDDAGCRETQCIDLNLFDVFETKDIQVKIYPNPADKEVNVELDKVAGNVEINLLTTDAKYIWRNEFSTFNRTLFTFDVTSLASAVYILEIMVNDEVIREKIIVR